MKKYLNAKEREQMVKLICVCQAAQDIIADWTSHDNLVVEERKYLRMGCAFINKAAEMIVRRLGALEGKKLIRTAHEVQITVIPRETQAAFRRRVEREAAEDGIWVSVNAIDDLAEMAMYACSPCRWQTPEEKAKCVGRSAYMALETPVFDSNPPDGVCPWEVRRC